MLGIANVNILLMEGKYFLEVDVTWIHQLIDVIISHSQEQYFSPLEIMFINYDIL